MNTEDEQQGDLDLLVSKHTEGSIPKRFFDTFGDIVTVNILFLITSLPIITIGASITAMNSMCIKWQTNRHIPVTKGYFQEFRKNFRQSTIVWLLQLAAMALLIFEYYLISVTEGALAKVCTFIFVVELVAFFLVFAWVYLILSVFKTKTFRALYNSILLSLSNPGMWLLLVAFWVLPIFGSILYTIILYMTWWIWPLFMFGFLGYISCSIGRYVFLDVEKRKKKKPTDEQ